MLLDRWLVDFVPFLALWLLTLRKINRLLKIAQVAAATGILSTGSPVLPSAIMALCAIIILPAIKF